MKKYLDSKLRRTAEEVKQYRIKQIILKIVCLTLAFVLIVMYLFSMLYRKSSQYEVNVKKPDNLDMSLVLCEYKYSDKYLTHLDFNSTKGITNISENMLPDNLTNTEGDQSSKTYSAFSFYVKNIGDKNANFQYSLYIKQSTKNIDEAIRVRLYINDSYKNYAKASLNAGLAEPGTISFENDIIIVNDLFKNIGANEYVKFTIVVWLEGNDPDCVDSVVGGLFGINIDIIIIENIEGEN